MLVENELPGKLIVIEGLDNAGKTTLIQRIQEYYENEQGKEVIRCREPGGTPLSEDIRRILLSEEGAELTDESSILLLVTSRLMLLKQVVRPHLEAGKIVLMDRFYHSTFAYATLDKWPLIDAVQSMTGVYDTKIDRTIFLDISREESLRRATLRGPLDPLERKLYNDFDSYRDRYLRHFTSQPQTVTLNANLDAETVYQLALATLPN